MPPIMACGSCSHGAMFDTSLARSEAGSSQGAMVVDLMRDAAGGFFVEDTGFVCPSTVPTLREVMVDNCCDTSACRATSVEAAMMIAEKPKVSVVSEIARLRGAVFSSSQRLHRLLSRTRVAK